MPKSVKITKEKILEAAFSIVREKGIESLSNRELAKKLNSSIRPIYYQFKNVEELNNELYIKIEKYFYKFLMDKMVDNIPPYKQVGINYIKFAKEETNFFKFLFMSGSDLVPKEFISRDNEDYQELTKLIKLSTQLKDEDIADFHTKMWVFTHGIAMLVATDTVKLTESQIKELLSLEFQALMLLEENKDNKWVSKD
ncbi:MAG: TetR/AcrR family transcriptional regulator [Firmicutes bacterium]|nr:TetR/AcrR family transcriptional regulator [Bacillota bacterium]